MFIARALAQEAELMLMDEPLAGLDTPSQESLLNLLDTLRSQKVTVMVATHDLEQAAQHFDRMLLLNHRIVALGSPDRVLQTENLLRAYGGRLHSASGENVLSVDDWCEGEDG
jgi:ABC-type Mn2+/Zn2+ transport system ATPase subunit